MPALAARIEPQKHFPELSNTRQRGVVPFDLSKAKQRDAEADVVIAFAKKVKDWPLLAKAVDQFGPERSRFIQIFSALGRVLMRAEAAESQAEFSEQPNEHRHCKSPRASP